jgi:hypothetical protein
MHANGDFQNMKESDHFENLGVDDGTILKRILKKHSVMKRM